VLIVFVVASAFADPLACSDPSGGIESQVQRPFNLGHPNDIAASSGLCLLILMPSTLLWKWRWPPS